MDSVDETNSGQSHARVVIVCITSEEAAVKAVVAKHAPIDWIARRRVQVIPIEDRFRGYGASIETSIDRAAPPTRATRVLALANVKRGEPGSLGNNRTDERIPSVKVLNRVLPGILEQAGADWFTHAVETIGGWHHHRIDETHVRKWLRQFDLLGNKRWIGKQLLQGMDFWSGPRWLESMRSAEISFEDFDVVCVNRVQLGKSADLIANLLSKQLKAGLRTPPLQDFYETLKCATSTERIIYIEDAVFTATETISLLNSLLGNVRPGRKAKVQPLPNLNALRMHQIHMVFPVSTNLGLERARAFLDEKALTNITIEAAPSGIIEVFTPAGAEAFTKGAFFDEPNSPKDPDRHLRLTAFENAGLWQDSERRREAIDFCKNIGEQLFRHYLRWAKYSGWSEAKIQRCALGMFGLSLNFAFAHSVPKAALPIFWMGGRVTLDGRSLEWIPLFPNAL